jgi:hypothetical protein
MANRENAFIEITPDVLLKAYACGIFPMAESADDPALYWIEPDMRGIIPLEGFHVPARLARTVRSTGWTIHVDRDFDAVIEGCAEPKQDRARTWINARIRRIYRPVLFCAGWSGSGVVRLAGRRAYRCFPVPGRGPSSRALSRLRPGDSAPFIHRAHRYRREHLRRPPHIQATTF